jgi:hypothetical protein
MSALLVLGGSEIALADPQSATITATCGAETVTFTTIINNQAGVAFVDGTVAGGSTSVARVGAETSSTVGTLRVPPPGFNVNGLPTTTCTFIAPFAPELGTITAEVLLTPVGSH